MSAKPWALGILLLLAVTAGCGKVTRLTAPDQRIGAAEAKRNVDASAPVFCGVCTPDDDQSNDSPLELTPPPRDH